MRVPIRNLPPLAESWGRSVDERLSSLSDALESSSLDSGNSDRMSGSSINNMSDQISELMARQVAHVAMSDMTTATFGPLNAPPTVSATTQLPRPDGGRRSGWLSVQARLQFAGPQDAYTSGFISFELDGEMIGTFAYSMPFIGLSSMFVDGYSVSYSAFVADASSGGRLVVSIGGRSQAAPGTRRIFATNISATVQYGQRV